MPTWRFPGMGRAVEYRSIALLLATASALWVFYIGRAEDRLDMSMLAMGGWFIANGAYPYVDFGIPTGPVPYLLQASGFLVSSSIYGCVLPAALFTAACVFGFVRLAQLGRWGWSAVLGIALIFGGSVFGNFGRIWYNETATVFGFTPIVCLILLPGLLETRTRETLFGFGISIGMSFLSKQDVGLLCMASLPLLLVAHPGLSVKKKLTGCVAYALGILSVTAVLLLPLLLQGKLEAFSYWFNLGQPPHNSRLSRVTFNIPHYVLANLRSHFREYTVAYAAALLSEAVTMYQQRNRKTEMIFSLYRCLGATAIFCVSTLAYQMSGSSKQLLPATAFLFLLAFKPPSGKFFAALNSGVLLLILLHLSRAQSIRWHLTQHATLVPKAGGVLKGELLHPANADFYRRYKTLLDGLSAVLGERKIRAHVEVDPFFWDERMELAFHGFPLHLQPNIFLFEPEAERFKLYVATSELDLLVFIERKNWNVGKAFSDAIYQTIDTRYRLAAEAAINAHIGRPEKHQVYIRNDHCRKMDCGTAGS